MARGRRAGGQEAAVGRARRPLLSLRGRCHTCSASYAAPPLRHAPPYTPNHRRACMHWHPSLSALVWPRGQNVKMATRGKGRRRMARGAAGRAGRGGAGKGVAPARGRGEQRPARRGHASGQWGSPARTPANAGKKSVWLTSVGATPTAPAHTSAAAVHGSPHASVAPGSKRAALPTWHSVTHTAAGARPARRARGLYRHRHRRTAAAHSIPTTYCRTRTIRSTDHRQ